MPFLVQVYTWDGSDFVKQTQELVQYLLQGITTIY
jgi:hypothetical protein